MAFKRAAKAPILEPPDAVNRPPGDTKAGLAWAGFLTAVIAGQWIWPSGYIFGTDWPGPRRFDWPTAVSSLLPLQGALALLSRLVSAQLTGELFILALLFVAAFTAFQAVPAQGFAPRGSGAAVYLLNPFVFSRIHYGQFALLAGYALLPLVAMRLRELCLRPTSPRGVILAISVSFVAVFTLHLFLVSGVLAAVVIATYVAMAKDRVNYIKSLIKPVAAAMATTGIVCAYWVVPLLTGRGSDAAAISATGTGLLTAYAAVPDQKLGLVPNLLGLYGFWAENSGRFTSMKAFVPQWPVILVIVLAISGIGAFAAFRRNASKPAPWTAGLVIAVGIALILEMGVSHPLTLGLVRWIDTTVPLYRGMRDAGKWAALLALVYSQLFGLGAGAILEWVHRLKLPATQLEWVRAAAIGLLVALPLYYGNGLLFGLHGEIKPSQYPAGWYAADRTLSADPHPGRTLFLPWHQYMAFDFIQNQNKVVASPAPSFFSVPILSSANPEIGGSAPTDPDQVAISSLVRAGATGDWGPELAARGIKYVLVAREVDWQAYGYLGQQPTLILVGNYVSILLYRNTLVT